MQRGALELPVRKAEGLRKIWKKPKGKEAPRSECPSYGEVGEEARWKRPRGFRRRSKAATEQSLCNIVGLETKCPGRSGR